ncbi:MAG TPA: DUF11 domain-containing protein [Anaerolineales bacterium]|nr:DUF11 domain-containing protein [Anaerolineales bacterium]
MKSTERERRDWLLILIIFFIGFLCIILAGNLALRFAPRWELPADMGSNLDPNRDFLTRRPSGFLNPLDPAILTPPIWLDVFLTPGVIFSSRTPAPTNTPTAIPPITHSPTVTPFAPTPSPTNTIIFASPTNTSVFVSPTLTSTTTRTSTPVTTATHTPTFTTTATPTPSFTFTPTFTATVTHTPSFTPTPTFTSTPTFIPTNTPNPSADLQVTKTDGSTTYTAGSTVSYVLVITNNGPADVTGATLTDNKPSLVTTWGWCIAPCTPVANTSANLTDTINLTAGSSITYNILANIHPSAAGDLINTASVTVPMGYIDPIPGNNSATDTNTNQSGEPEVGPPDGGVISIGDGGSVTFYLSQPIVANGDGAADFVYYELYIPAIPGIYLDQVIIEISADGSTWFPVFYWGDNAADTNTNVNIALPNINAACPSGEVDNCPIPSSELYNNSGVTIDVDNSPLSAVPLGNYYWIRFTEPGLTPGDGAHVDSIEILP